MSPSRIGERTACALATRMTEHILDVLGGRRRLDQLRDRLSGPVAGLLSSVLNTTRRAEYRLRSVHACMTSRSRVEACAVVAVAGRIRAFVLRLEQEDTRWCCTLLSVL